MKKVLIAICILLVSFNVSAQNPVIASNPYDFTKWIRVKDSAILRNIPSLSDSSDKVVNSKWIKQQGYTTALGAGWGLNGNTGISFDNFIGTLEAKPFKIVVNNDTVAKFGINQDINLGWYNVVENPASVAIGQSNEARGGSAILGNGNVADSSSTILGESNVADNFSTVVGMGNTATGLQSTSVGFGNYSYQDGATTIGIQNEADGKAATAIGYGSRANSDSALAIQGGDAIGRFSFANGYTTAYSYKEIALGCWNEAYSPTSQTTWIATDRLFQIGNGIPGFYTSNALTILKNGKTGIGTTTPTHLLHIKSNDSSVLRIEGLIQGPATDSMLTLDVNGNVHKRVIPGGGGSIDSSNFAKILSTNTFQANQIINGGDGDEPLTIGSLTGDFYGISATTSGLIAGYSLTDSTYQLMAGKISHEEPTNKTLIGGNVYYSQAYGGGLATDSMMVISPSGLLRLKKQPTAIDSIRLVNTGILHTSPATFSLSGNTGVVTQTLATQSAYKVFRSGNTSSTPTFGNIDSTYWGNTFKPQVLAATAGNYAKAEIYNVQSLTVSPLDAIDYYFGQLPKTAQTTGAISKIYFRKAGTVTGCNLYTYAGTPGSNESWTIALRLNNTTDYTISTVSLNTAERIFNNSSMSITVAAGDYIEVHSQPVTWASNPASVVIGGYIEFLPN